MNDYGCFSDEANDKVHAVVQGIRDGLKDGQFKNGQAVVDYMREGMVPIGDGACDTVVKESAAFSLEEDMKEAGLAFPPLAIYGW